MNKAITKQSKKHLNISDEARELLLELGTLILAFLVTGVRFFFDTYPFGIAFCASCKGRTPFAVVGSALGALIFHEAPIPYLIALLFLIGLRVLGSLWLGEEAERLVSLGERSRPGFVSRLFSERVSVRVAVGALCSLGLLLFRVVTSGGAIYDAFVLAFTTVLTSIFTYSLCFLYENHDTSRRLLGFCAVLFIIVYMIRGRELFGLDISIVISYAVALYASRHTTGGKSVAIGALLGVCHGPAFAPVFAIGALVSSLLWDFSYYISIIGALVISIGYGVFSSGYEAIVYLLPELLFASLIMYPLTRFEILPSVCAERATGDIGKEIFLAERSDYTTASLEGARDALKDISAMLLELSHRSKNPSREFWHDTCLEICESHCYSCPKRSICWERDASATRENIFRIGDAAFSDMTVAHDCVEERFLHRCPNIDKIIEQINSVRRDIDDDRLRYGKLEISSDDYEMSARLIDELLTSLNTRAEYDEALSDKALRACRRVGLKLEGARVIAGRPLIVTLVSIDTGASKCSADEVQKALEDALDIPLDAGEIEELSGVSVMKFKSKSRYCVSCDSASAPMSEGEPTGDTICFFESEDGHHYMLLCDGMGSGREASATSKMCAELLSRLLRARASKELCLSMLNSFIRAKSPESSSSVDLLEIDLDDGQAQLIKGGAAPTFVKRGEKIFRLHSRTAPIGIMKELNAERIDFSLRDNDIVIMVSDGVASDERDSKYLVDFLSSVEIVSDDTPTESVVQTQSVMPANAPPPPVAMPAPPDDLLWIISGDAPQKIPTPKHVRISDLPNAILSAAISYRGASRDDMTVGVAVVNAES